MCSECLHFTQTYTFARLWFTNWLRCVLQNRHYTLPTSYIIVYLWKGKLGGYIIIYHFIFLCTHYPKQIFGDGRSVHAAFSTNFIVLYVQLNSLYIGSSDLTACFARFSYHCTHIRNAPKMLPVPIHLLWHDDNSTLSFITRFIQSREPPLVHNFSLRAYILATFWNLLLPFPHVCWFCRPSGCFVTFWRTLLIQFTNNPLWLPDSMWRHI